MIAEDRVVGEGAQVVLGKVDPFGFNGRDRPPSRTDEGCVGYVLQAHVERYDEEGCVLGIDQAYGGEPLGEGDVAIYLVGLRDGRSLEVVHHELASAL